MEIAVCLVKKMNGTAFRVQTVAVTTYIICSSTSIDRRKAQQKILLSKLSIRQ